MLTNLITTIWGVPIVGQAASNQVLNDSVLELEKEGPQQNGESPADIFLQIPFAKNRSGPAWFGAHPLTRIRSEWTIPNQSPDGVFASSSWQSSGDWSLPVPIEIAKSPEGSGNIRPISPEESAEEYVQTSLSILLERVVQGKKYGLSRSDADRMIGDLWFILDQLTAAGKKTDFFWTWILNELMWGDVLESPSNKDVADKIVSSFLPWMDRLVPEDFDLQQIASAVLKKPLVTRGFRNISICYRHLSRLLPCLESNPFFAKSVVLGAVQMALTDMSSDIKDRLEAIENFLAEVSPTLQEIVTLEAAWHSAYHRAWNNADEKSILGLEDLAQFKGWDEKTGHHETRRIYRQSAMRNAVSRLHEEHFSAEDLCKLAFMLHRLHRGPLSRFESELIGIFESDAIVKWTNIDIFTHFLLILWTAAAHHQITFGTVLEYQNIINTKLKGQLQRQLRELMPLSPDIVVAIKASLVHADNLLVASLKGRVYAGMAKKFAEESLQEMVVETLTATDRPDLILMKRWENFERSYQELAGDFPEIRIGGLLEAEVEKRTAAIFADIPPEEIGEALCHLFERVTWMTTERKSAEMIAQRFYALLRQRLFGKQSNPDREDFVNRLEEGGGDFSFFKPAGPSRLPWILSDGSPYGTLIDVVRHTELKYLETSYRLAKILDAENQFLAIARRALSREIRLYAPLATVQTLRQLSATEHIPLREVIQEVACELNVVITSAGC